MAKASQTNLSAGPSSLRSQVVSDCAERVERQILAHEVVAIAFRQCFSSSGDQKSHTSLRSISRNRQIALEIDRPEHVVTAND